ncbi:ComF family protein [Olivibacter ginsenosidimutans]|uniref:ComF family protein n=1 Tax=Olivibacter ginsenosidimutans TaxID=1176537 RepID=A0ABP9C4X4_9SPHI
MWTASGERGVKSKPMLRYLKHFFSLLYPDLCLGCKRPLYEHEVLICTHCWYHLPLTNFHLDKANAAARQLWGRVPLEQVTACFYFIKGTQVQQILHHLKYLGKSEVGIVLGKKYGLLLKDTVFHTADVILPVPLHPKKLKRRTYNQSEYFAKGLSYSLDIPIELGNLIRHSQDASQTTKNRFERYENMRSAFHIQDPEKLEGKHVLLVDDVFTTGATIEACANVLLEIPEVKVSVIALAYTH